LELESTKQWLIFGNKIMRIILEGSTRIHIISAYAPTAEADLAEKERFSETLELLYKAIQKHEICYLGGDFNAKIIELSEVEEETYGRFEFHFRGYER
jgi:exonuclease III